MAPYRFGVFEFDASAGELRKQGIKIHLQGQPIEVLTLLLSHPGEVVTREELQKKLWPADTFVEFDAGLNAAIKRLRAALNDDPTTPRYIETLPRKGYRFVGTAARPRPRWLRGLFSQRRPLVTIAVTATLMLMFATWRYYSSSTLGMPRRVESLAVLPLEDISQDPQERFFAEGMTVEIIGELSRLRGLKYVVPRSTVIRYRGTGGRPLREIARELGVDGLLAGTVFRADDRVRIDVQLLDAATDAQIWSARYERELKDIITLQREVTQAIAEAVQVKLSPVEKERLGRLRPINPRAFDLYTMAVHHRSRMTREDLSAAINLLSEVTRLEPDYARAHAMLADCYDMASHYIGMEPTEAFPRARAAAQKAIDLDPTLAEAYNALAWARFVYDHDWAGAEKDFKRALELNPNYSRTRMWYGISLVWRGDKEAGLAELWRAHEAEPYWVMNRNFYGVGLYLSRRYDEALAEFDREIELDPNFIGAHAWRGLVLVQKGRAQEGAAALERSIELGATQNPVFARLGFAYAKAGSLAKTKAMLAKVQELAKSEHVASSDMACLYAALGERERAFAWFEKVPFDRNVDVMFVKMDPRFDFFRDDPRFEMVLRRMNFPR